MVPALEAVGRWCGVGRRAVLTDGVCTAWHSIEALSVNLRQQTLDAAGRNLTRLAALVDNAKAADARRLREEYTRLVQGVAAQGLLDAAGQRALHLGEDQVRRTNP